MSLNAFLDSILDKKREAEARGFRLDLIVLHVDFYDTLMRAIATERAASSSFKLVQNPHEEERKDVYLYDVKVMWSGNRLPTRQVWFRYSSLGSSEPPQRKAV